MNVTAPAHTADDTTAVITPARPRDPFGDPFDATPAPAPARSHTVPGCRLAPAESTEDQHTADTITTSWTLYAPADTTIHATDEVTIAGITAQVVGDPKRWAGAGVVATLRRVTG